MTAPLPHPRRSLPEGMAFAQWRADDGWPLRSFAWSQTGQARGSMLFLNGRGDFVEKYLEVLAHWHDRGWNMAGFDWRGQGGSGRLLADPLTCHQDSFDPLVRDLTSYVEEWVRTTPGPHTIVAHSMGGHLTLRMLTDGVGGIDAAVLACPMIDIRVAGVRGHALGLIGRGASLIGLRRRKVWHRDIGDVGGRMTSCPERRADKVWWKTTYPAIASGPPSWGWVLAARKSIQKLTPQRLSAITTPTLLLGTEGDPVVDVRAIRRAAATLPNAEVEIFEGGGHELLREADSRRLPVLDRIDGFLARFA